MKSSHIIIYTDGSSLGNPGPGGFAGIILIDGKETIVKGGEPHTTNNRMEMRAMIEALKWIKKNAPQSQIMLYSDSNLLVQSLNLNWKRKKNLDLWKDLDEARKGLMVNFQWVKAHNTDIWNNRCDKIAVNEAKKY